MSKIADEGVMRDLHILKINAYKAVDDVLQKRKTDESISHKEMEGSRNKVVPLINSFVQSVSTHLETLEKKEGDNDDEIESWEMHAELVCIKWQQCFEFSKQQEIASNDTSAVAEVTVGDREGNPAAGVW